MDKRQYWRERRRRCYEWLAPEPYKEIAKLAATDVETGSESDGFTLGAPIVGWIITTSDGQEWLGDTCAGWVARLLSKALRGYTILCHSEYELSYLCQFLVTQRDGVTLAPITRKDGTFLALKCTQHKHMVKFVNTMGVCNTTLEKYLAAYAPATPKQPRAWGTDAAPNYWRADDPADVAYLQADGRGLLEAYTNQRRETHANFGVNLRLTSGATAIAAHRATLPRGARYWRQHADVDAVCRDAAHGGLVIAATTCEQKEMVHIDRNAMYAWSEKTYGAPVGLGCFVASFRPGRPGFYRCRVRVPASERVPFLAARAQSGDTPSTAGGVSAPLVWAVGCTFATTLTDIEITEARRLHYQVRVGEGVVFERRDLLYSAFLARCESMELGDVDPHTGKKGVHAENAKGLRNPLSGKFGSGNEAPRYLAAAVCPDGYTPVLDPHTGIGSDFLHYRMETVEAPHLMPHWYAYTTAGARVAISRLMRDYGAVYCDTDSLVLPRAALEKAVAAGAVELGSAYGQWKIEAHYRSFRAGGPKNYLAVLDGVDGATVSKTKGTPRKLVNARDHARALDGEKVEVTYRSVRGPLQFLKHPTEPLWRMQRRAYSRLEKSAAWRRGAHGRIEPRALVKG